MSKTDVGLTHIGCKSHPLRTDFYDELHVRPFHNVTTPQSLSHKDFRAEKSAQAETFEMLCDLCRHFDVEPPQPKTGCFIHNSGEFNLHWESHVESYYVTE